jgi:hypothetical protein
MSAAAIGLYASSPHSFIRSRFLSRTHGSTLPLLRHRHLASSRQHPNHPQNCPPTLNVTSLVSSPFCLISAFARSIRKGPNGEFQLTPTPIDTRGRGLLPE